MKKIIFLCMLLLSGCIPVPAQCVSEYTKHPNALYVTFQPRDLGFGGRYDYHIKGFGVYNSISYGNWYEYRKIGLSNHFKLTMGVMIPLRDWNGWHYDITGGINYHHTNGSLEDFGRHYVWYNPFDREISYQRIKYPWSFELGVTVKMRRFALSIRTDFPRWEPCVDIGIPLNFNKR